MSALIDEIINAKNITAKLGLGNVSIATDKIIVSGHSFGAITSLYNTMNDPRIACCLSYDPWLYVCMDDINSNKFKMTKPFATICTQHFPDDNKPYCN